MNSMFAIVSARAPCHRHAVAGRDVGIGRVEINFPATAGRQHDPVRPNRFYLAGFFIENVNAEATIFRRETELGRGDQIDRHVIFQKIDMRLAARVARSKVFSISLPGHVSHVQNAPLRMTAFPAEIEFAMPGDFALVELQRRARSSREFAPGLLS